MSCIPPAAKASSIVVPAPAVDRMWFNTTTTGTGTLAIGSALSSYQTPAAANVADGNWLNLLILDGTAWERSVGKYTASGPSLTRNLLESSTGSLLSLSGSATVIITTGPDDLACFMTAQFGTGADGNVTISSGTTTLTRDMHYNNLTLTGGTIDPRGFRIFVAGTLDLSNAPANAIAPAANPGGSASGATRTSSVSNFSGSIGLARMTLDTGVVGSNGTSGGTGAGGNGNSATVNNAVPGGVGGAAGAGGAGVSAGGAGGTITDNSVTINSWGTVPAYRSNGSAAISGAGGAAGGGDGSNSGGGGGSGGSGPYGIEIFARRVLRGASTAASAIACKGNVGGNGGNGTGGNTGGGGGGGGSGGGYVLLVAGTLLGTTASNALDVSGGNGVGTGIGGTGGTGGKSGTAFVYTLSAAAATSSTRNLAGSAGSAGSGVTGGAGGAGAVGQLSL